MVANKLHGKCMGLEMAINELNEMNTIRQFLIYDGIFIYMLLLGMTSIVLGFIVLATENILEII